MNEGKKKRENMLFKIKNLRGEKNEKD